jgi:hypothetical protein
VPYAWKNKNNLDPKLAVRYGEPTYDEMMIGWAEQTRSERIKTWQREYADDVAAI